MTDKNTGSDAVDLNKLTRYEPEVGSDGYGVRAQMSEYPGCGDYVRFDDVADLIAQARAAAPAIAASTAPSDQLRATLIELADARSKLTDAYAKLGGYHSAAPTATAEPVARILHLQFLTDVVTAAGLLKHGKRDKALATRISDRAYEIREALCAVPAPQQAAPLTDAPAIARLLALASEEHADAAASAQHGANTADVPEWARLVVKLFESAGSAASAGDARDATRYRWLREQRGERGDLPIDGDVWVVQMHQPNGAIPELRCAGFGDKLDRAVDEAIDRAAMAATQEKKQ